MQYCLNVFSWSLRAHTRVSDRSFDEFHSFFRLLHSEVAASSDVVLLFTWARSAHTCVSARGIAEFRVFYFLDSNTTRSLHPVIFFNGREALIPALY